MTFAGTSVGDFFQRFPTERACLNWIFATKWGEHSPCPNCSQIGGWTPIEGTKKYRHRCRRQFSPLKGTIFYRSNLPLMAGFYAMLLFANSSSGVRSSFVRKQLGIGLRAAHRLCNQIRVHMATYERPKKLGGLGKRVCIDEVYLKHVRMRGRDQLVGAIVLGLECDGKTILGIVPDRKRHTLKKQIRRYVSLGSTVITDDWIGYKGLTDIGYKHIAINHSLGYFFDEYGRTTNSVEACWASLRRSLRLYHQVGEKNLWRFLAENEFRYNHRFSKISPFDVMVSNWPDLNELGMRSIKERFDWRTNHVSAEY